MDTDVDLAVDTGEDPVDSPDTTASNSSSSRSMSCFG